MMTLIAEMRTWPHEQFKAAMDALAAMSVDANYPLNTAWWLLREADMPRVIALAALKAVGVEAK